MTLTNAARSQTDIALVSVCGPVRAENEDAALVWRHEDRGETVAIIADGMGGHEKGREAAEIVVRTCHRELTAEHEVEVPERLRAALMSAHDELREAVEKNGSGSMGATAVLVLITANARGLFLWLGHVGDSRAYLVRGRSIYRLTQDHSLVGQMVRDGLLGEEEAFDHPDNNVVHRALGQVAPLEPELTAEPLQLNPGDRVILCSDGLHGAVRDSELLALVAESATSKEVCQQLSTAALEAGSEDNISVVCVRCPEERQRRPTRID